MAGAYGWAFWKYDVEAWLIPVAVAGGVFLLWIGTLKTNRRLQTQLTSKLDKEKSKEDLKAEENDDLKKEVQSLKDDRARLELELQQTKGSLHKVHEEHPDKASVIRSFTGSGPGHGVYFTPDDLQDMSSRAIDILKRFVDENTMLRKEVVRLQDDHVDEKSYFRRTGPADSQSIELAHLRDLVSKTRDKEREYLTHISDLEKGLEDIQRGQSPVIRNSVHYNPFSTEPEKNGMDIADTSSVHRPGSITLTDKRSYQLQGVVEVEDPPDPREVSQAQSVPPLPIPNYQETLLVNPQLTGVSTNTNPFRLPAQSSQKQQFTPTDRKPPVESQNPMNSRTMWQISKDLQSDLQQAVTNLQKYSPRTSVFVIGQGVGSDEDEDDNAMKREYDLVDLDANGELDAQEIRIAHSSASEEELWEFFQNADTDLSATVSFVEYTDFVMRQ